MERRITRRSSAIAAAAAGEAAAVASAAAAAMELTHSGEATGTTHDVGLSRSRSRGLGRGRGMDIAEKEGILRKEGLEAQQGSLIPRSEAGIAITADQEQENELVLQQENEDEQRQKDSGNALEDDLTMHIPADSAVTSQSTEESKKASEVLEARAALGEPVAEQKPIPGQGDVLASDLPENQDEFSAANVSEKMTNLVLPDTKSRSTQEDALSTTSGQASIKPVRSNAGGCYFFSEDLYNGISRGGTGAAATSWYFERQRSEEEERKKQQEEEERKKRKEAEVDETTNSESDSSSSAEGSSSSNHDSSSGEDQGSEDSEEEDEAVKKSRVHDASAKAGVSQTPAGSSTAVASGSKFDISQLVASVTSYGPEIASALHTVNPAQKPKETKKQAAQQKLLQHQQQQSSLMPLKAAGDRFQHPCVYSHDHRSILTRDEHRRYLLYEAITRSQQKGPSKPQLGPEDRVLWALLQEKADQERLRVRQWNAEVIRSRISGYFNPAIRVALESKFKHARTRVMEGYPQYYDFVQSIGLRLPSVHSTSKEPTLIRKSPDVTAAATSLGSSTAPMTDPSSRGLLKRIGKICPVSLAKPIWPTDENGVPYERAIDVDDRYWRASASSPESSAVQAFDLEARKSEQDNRRSHIPSKRPAQSVANDPIANRFVKEQNVHIALAASALVALAKVLPNLTAEWEIPVKVVLEKDNEGVMQKRIYMDKPLISKRMSALEMTQTFYDGALKKLSLVGSQSTDVGILTSGPMQATEKAPAQTTIEQGKVETVEKVVESYTDSEDIEMTEQGSNEFKDDAVANASETKPQDARIVELDNKIKDDDMVKSKSQDVVMAEEGSNASKEAIPGAPEKAAAPVSDIADNGEEHTLGSLSGSSEGDECINDGFEYTLWSFGETRILIRSRLHGYITNSDPYRQVVLKSVLDYTPDIGLPEPSKSTMAGWWMATWIRNDRLIALGHVDVSQNQFVRYPDQHSAQSLGLNPQNPLGGIFSDLPAITILDASAQRVQDRDIRDWIKPNMRLIHYVLGKLMNLGPGQYILGHKRLDVNATIYKAVKDESMATTGSAESTPEKKGVSPSVRGRYDLHAAHRSSPQMFSESNVDSGGSSTTGGGHLDDDLHIRWIGTPDQIPGTFPYDEPEVTTTIKRRARGSRGNARKRGRGRGKSQPGEFHPPSQTDQVNIQ